MQRPDFVSGFACTVDQDWVYSSSMAMTPQVAFVTGASRGIGRGIAIELARLGFSIAINYAQRQEVALECKRRGTAFRIGIPPRRNC